MTRPLTPRLPDAWLEIDNNGRVIGVSIEKDLTSPFGWVPVYTQLSEIGLYESTLKNREELIEWQANRIKELENAAPQGATTRDRPETDPEVELPAVAAPGIDELRKLIEDAPAGSMSKVVTTDKRGPTPRTDHVLLDIGMMSEASIRLRLAEFSRQLERELDEALDELEDMDDDSVPPSATQPCAHTWVKVVYGEGRITGTAWPGESIYFIDGDRQQWRYDLPALADSEGV